MGRWLWCKWWPNYFRQSWASFNKSCKWQIGLRCKCWTARHSGKDRRSRYRHYVHIFGEICERQHGQMVITMGLHPGINAAHQHSVVLHLKFIGHCAIPIGNGGHDYATHTAQRHRTLQSNGLWWRCARRIWLEIGARRRLSAVS